MEGKELAQKLVRGQENIDRMKREIKSILGLICSIIGNHGKISFEFMTQKTIELVLNDYKWIFRRVRVSGDMTLQVEAECWVPIYTRNGSTSAHGHGFGYSTARGVERGFYVRKVHEGLSYLLEELQKDPVVNERWQFLLDAADYEF